MSKNDWFVFLLRSALSADDPDMEQALQTWRQRLHRSYARQSYSLSMHSTKRLKRQQHVR